MRFMGVRHFMKKAGKFSSGVLVVLAVLFFTLPCAALAAKSYYQVETETIKGHTRFTHHKQTYEVTTFLIDKKARDAAGTQLTYKATFFEQLHVLDLIPSKVKTRGMKHLWMKDMLILSLMPPKTPSGKFLHRDAAYKIRITQADIPPAVLSKIQSNGPWQDLITIKNQGTFRGFFNRHDSTELAAFLSLMGVSSQTPYVITGSSKYNPVLTIKSGKVQVLQSGEAVTQKGKESDYIKAFSLDFRLPDISLPGTDGQIQLTDLNLGTGTGLYTTAPWRDLPPGLKGAAQGDVGLFLSGGTRVKLLGNTYEGRALLDFGKSGDGSSKDLALLSFMDDRQAFNKLFDLTRLNCLKGLSLGGDAGLKIDIAETKNDQGKTGDAKINITAFGGIRVKNKPIDFTADVELDAKKETLELRYMSVDDTFTLADLSPKIPYGKTFALKEVKFYPPYGKKNPGGLEAKAEIFGVESDIYLFDVGNDDHVLAVDVAGKGQGETSPSFNLGKLARTAGLSKTFPAALQTNLDGFLVGNGALILSTSQLDVSISDLKKGIAKDLFTAIFGHRKHDIHLGEVTFVSDFDAGMAGSIGTMLAQGKDGVSLGVKEDTYILGTVGGLFTEAPLSLELEFLTDQAFDIKKLGLTLPAAFTHSAQALDPDMKEGLFLKILDEDAEVGLLTGFGFTVNGVPLAFTGTFGFQLAQEDMGFSITGTADDKISNMFGIKHFDVTEVTLNATIGNNVTCGLGMKTSYLGRHMDIDENISFSVKGVPNGIGFKTTISRLDKDGWILADRTLILAVPTFAGFTAGTLTGGVGVGAISALAGAVGGGVVDVPTGAVPGAAIVGVVGGAAGVLGGAVVVGTTSALLGAAAGILIDVVVPEKDIAWIADKEAWLLKADSAYLSFATANASSADWGIPPGIHFNIDNITFFNAHNVGHLKPDFTWIYLIQKDLQKGVNGIKNVEKEIKRDFKKAEDRFKKAVKEARQKGIKDPEKEVLKAFKFTEDEIAKAKKYVKILADNYHKLMSVLNYELGLSDKKPDFKYTRPEKETLETFKKTLNSISLKNVKLGPLTLAKADVTLIPRFELASSAKILGTRNDITIKLDKALYFDTREKLGDLGEVDLRFTYDDTIKDFTVLADITASIGPRIDTEVTQGISEIITTADSGAQKAKKALDDAAKAVEKAHNALTSKTAAIRKSLEKEFNVASLEDDFQTAENYLNNGVNKAIDKACGSFGGKHCKTLCWPTGLTSHKCKKYCVDPKQDCKEGLKGLKTEAQKAYNKTRDALKTAQQNVATQLGRSKILNRLKGDLNQATQHMAYVAALYDNIKDELHALKELGDEAVKAYKQHPIAVKEAVLVGRLSDLKTQKPLILKLVYTLNGQERTAFFGFKPGNASYNAKALALLPVTVFDEFIHQKKVMDQLAREQGTGKAPAASTGTKDFSEKSGKQQTSRGIDKVANWIMTLLDKQLAAIVKELKTEFAAQEKRYKPILDSFEHTRSGLGSYTSGFTVDLYQKSFTYSQTDMMPASKRFQNKYLAVGHSALCLGVAPDGIKVFQENCRDSAGERWSTTALDDGYVQLKSKGLCLKAETRDNNQTLSDPLRLSACVGTDPRQQWKVISFDGYFDKVVNRYSQKCLHFDTENANPRTAYAVWTSCLGMDSQAFRDIEDAERPTWHPVQDRVQSRNNYCLAPAKAFIGYFSKTDKGHATITADKYKQMRNKKDDILTALPCGSAEDDRFNYVEMVNGDIRLVHDKSGWCVAPGQGAGGARELELRPCSSSASMIWRNLREGDGFMMQNNDQAGRCLSLAPVPGDPKTGTASLKPCRRGSDDMDIDFIQ